MNPAIFREYDIRGIADRDLTDEVVYRFGQAYGTYIQSKGVYQCIIGRDVRLSGPRIEKTLVAGLTATGVDVVKIGIVPTPVFYFSCFHLNINAGIMITASHNPPDENGFKIALHKTTIYGEEIQELRRLMEADRFRTGKGQINETDVIPAYIQLCHQKVKITRPLKVVFDPGNGTAGVLLERLISGYPLQPTFINLNPDGAFPAHVPDPTVPQHLEQAVSLVRETGADCGFGYDGDADRIGAIDEKGNTLYGDRLLAIFARDILTRHPGARIVFEVKCSQGLVEYIQSLGGIPVMWKTGHSLIKAKMKEEGALIAGEMSGHMFFAEDYYGYDDAIFASLRLLQILDTTGKSLSQLTAEIPYYCATPEIRVRITSPDADQLKFHIVKKLQDHFRKNYQVIDIDGARVVFDDGWGLVRASNTQPILVLRFEARTPERLKQIEELFWEQLRQFPEIVLPRRKNSDTQS
ncbi:MAG: phosphomannomutase/phosphoglucomutase [candidate division WOR-3 bacterium]|uniref:Phosphomannomutase/phosphoglucomutase n=1 Tax=candidate division WOR-3 bacterium TaxID=2052148 RepID=A0A7C1SC64_UNCW3|nr:phosphomannomutase/phosphoglucomutase [candidate division WOR-3 bacterium]